MRIRWMTPFNWWFVDISVWWKSCRLGFWYDNWCGCKELDIYILFWTIEIRCDKILKVFSDKAKKEGGKNGKN